MTDSAPELLPSKEVLVELMDLVNHSPESAKYLSENFKAILEKKRMLEKFNALANKFDAYTQEVQLGESPGTNIWRGEQPLSNYANASEQRVRAVENKTPPPEGAVVAVGIEFGADKKLNRGYMYNEQPADAKATERLDLSFHAWLARVGLLCRDQIIYLGTEQGDIKKNEAGEPLRVSLDEFKQRAEAEGSGLKSYLETHAHGIRVAFVQVKIPPASLTEAAAPVT